MPLVTTASFQENEVYSIGIYVELHIACMVGYFCVRIYVCIIHKNFYYFVCVLRRTGLLGRSFVNYTDHTRI